MGVEMTLLRALAFHPRMPLPEPEVPRQSFAPVAPTAVMTPTQCRRNRNQRRSRLRLYRSGTTRCWRRASSCSAVQDATKAKRVNRQPLPARPVNNAALERLASVTDRVQRPVPSALEKAPAKKKRIAGRATIGDAAKEVVATPKALKKRWNMKNAGTGGEAGGRSH